MKVFQKKILRWLKKATVCYNLLWKIKVVCQGEYFAGKDLHIEAAILEKNYSDKSPSSTLPCQQQKLVTDQNIW